MLRNRATAEGTAAYARRHPGLPGNFRPMLGGLNVSSIGIGTYLGDPDDETDAAYVEAIEAALLGGINLIDTAVNYRFQRGERAVGKVLAELIGSGALRREEVVVATKGGYLTFDGAMPPNPRAWFEEHFVRSGLVGPQDLVEGAHCITPRYLGAMLEMSRSNLGLHHRHLLPAQSRNPARHGRARRVSRPDTSRVRVSRAAGGRGRDRSLRHRDPERLSGRRQRTPVPPDGGASENRPRDRRPRPSFPRRPASVQSCDAGGADARQPAASGPPRHDAARGSRLRPRRMRQRIAPARAARARAAADRGRGVRGAEHRRAARGAVRALGAGNQRGAGRNEVGGAREGNPGGRALPARLHRGLFQVVHAEQERVSQLRTGRKGLSVLPAKDLVPASPALGRPTADAVGR